MLVTEKWIQSISPSSFSYWDLWFLSLVENLSFPTIVYLSIGRFLFFLIIFLNWEWGEYRELLIVEILIYLSKKFYGPCTACDYKDLGEYILSTKVDQFHPFCCLRRGYGASFWPKNGVLLNVDDLVWEVE